VAEILAVVELPMSNHDQPKQVARTGHHSPLSANSTAMNRERSDRR
jgi:hypothetical protein